MFQLCIRCQEFKQNQLFRTKQKLFYESLDGKERGETELPKPSEATTFWSGIRSEEVSHNNKESSSGSSALQRLKKR